MSKELYKEDFLLGLTLFLFTLGVLLLGWFGKHWPVPFGYNLFWILVISGVSAFFSLVFAMKTVIKK